MERSSRLRKYLRKDYTQSVDFPVEIVGRDGRVRRYSYDESVRLYQRRIRSAIARLDDQELVDAEVRHCGLRIEQLRRSLLEHHPVPRGQGRVYGTLLGAEIVDFLTRHAIEGLDLGTLQLVSTSDAGDVLWVGGAERACMVYAYRLDSVPSHAAFVAQRLLLQSVGPASASAESGDGVERLWGGQETPELGILLAGLGPWDGQVIESEEEDAAAEPSDGPAEAVAMRALREGNIAEALRHLEDGMESAPLEPALALAAAAVALLDHQAERARFAAVFGAKHAPPGVARSLLSALLAVAQFRLRDPVGALASVSADPGTPLANAVYTLLMLHRFRPAALFRMAPLPGPGARAANWVRAWGLRWVGGSVLASASALTAAVAVAAVSPWSAGILVGLAVIIPIAVTVRLATVSGQILRAEQEPGLLLGMELLGR